MFSSTQAKNFYSMLYDCVPYCISLKNSNNELIIKTHTSWGKGIKKVLQAPKQHKQCLPKMVEASAGM